MSLQEIIDWDLAVPMSKLVKITGYSRMEIKRIDPPMVCKKIRPSDFWAHVRKLQKQFQQKPQTKVEHKPDTDIRTMAQRIMA
jgi:hypothetical protein